MENLQRELFWITSDDHDDWDLGDAEKLLMELRNSGLLKIAEHIEFLHSKVEEIDDLKQSVESLEERESDLEDERDKLEDKVEKLEKELKEAKGR